MPNSTRDELETMLETVKKMNEFADFIGSHKRVADLMIEIIEKLLNRVRDLEANEREMFGP